MRTSEKLNYLLGHAFGALCAMRDIDVENDDEAVAGDVAMMDLKVAFAGGKPLSDDEQRTLRPLIDAWRKIAATGKDVDDGQSWEDWQAEIETMIAGLPERTYVTATDGVDTAHIAF